MNHHPEIELLLKYASGQLEPSLAVAIGLHHQHCEICQQQIGGLETIGGEMLAVPTDDTNPKDKVEAGSFDKLFSEVEELEQDTQIGQYEDLAVAQSDIPLIDKLNNQRFEEIDWKRVSPNIWRADIAMNDPSYEVELLKFSANTKLPKHTHNGNEYTLVLQGDFSDNKEKYNKGEFIAQGQTTEHQPIAGKDGCICMAITDAPLKFTGTLGPVLNWLNKN